VKKYLIKEESVSRATAFITPGSKDPGARECSPVCTICDKIGETARKIIAVGVGGTLTDPTGVDRFRLEEAVEGEDTFLGRLLRDESRQGNLSATDQGTLEDQHASLMDTIAAAPLYEAVFVLRRLRAGKVDGSTFGDGGRRCSCLLGTMATAANIVEGERVYRGGEFLGDELSDKGARHLPAQNLFYAIESGDKTSTSMSAALADQFITELLMSNCATLGREERATARRLERALKKPSR
jgi:hypothetical protein